MKSLADQYPEAWAAIEQAGFISLTEMARRVTAPGTMDAALGYASAAHKWNKGRMPGAGAERRAAEWLARTKAPADSDMLIVVCPEGVSPKARRLLTVLGCEVEAL